MSFGGGSQSSQQQSSGFDISKALGVDWNNQVQQNVNEQFSKGGSYIAGQQLPFLENLWKMASDTYSKIPDLQSVGQKTLQPFMSGARSAFDTLGGLTNTDELIRSQTEGLKSGLNDFLGQGLLGIKGQATASGAFGGDRHALQEAALGGEVAKAYTQGYGDIVNNARTQASGAAQAQAGLAPQLYNLGMSPYMANFAPLQALANLLGGPTVLSQQQSGGYGSGFSYGSGGGINSSSGYGQRQGTQTSEGWDFNIGGR